MKPKRKSRKPQTKHRAVDPEVCPQCGSDATSAIVQIDDEVEGTVCCSACGIHYEVVRENGLKYVYWTDDEGEHFLYDDDYLVRRAAHRLLDAAAELFSNARDNGECFIDREDDRYDPEHPEQMYPDWAELDAAVREAKGEPDAPRE